MLPLKGGGDAAHIFNCNSASLRFAVDALVLILFIYFWTKKA